MIIFEDLKTGYFRMARRAGFDMQYNTAVEMVMDNFVILSAGVEFCGDELYIKKLPDSKPFFQSGLKRELDKIQRADRVSTGMMELSFV